MIINPIAGKGRGYRAWRAIRPRLQQAGWDLHEATAEQHGEAWPLAEAASRDALCNLVVAVGGDGTVHEVVNGLLRGRPERPPTLAIIPGGTANILTYALGISNDPAKAAELLLTGTTRRIDLGQVNNRYYASVAGVGFDGEVAARANRWRRRWTGTKPLYVGAMLATLASYQPVECSITIDGVEHSQPTFLLSAANTPWYGGGMHIAPHARVDSGTLAIVIAGDLSRLEAFGVLLRVFSGAHLRHPKVAHTTAREVHVRSRIPVVVHADGETVGFTPVTFRVVPGALNVLVPQ